MSINTINLAFRFMLEVLALVAVGTWGFSLSYTFSPYLLAIGIPVLCAAIWGTFNVKGDPGRSGNAPVQVPGWLRLGIELAFFAFACFALYRSGYQDMSIGFAVLTLLHYIFSIERIRWLLRQN